MYDDLEVKQSLTHGECEAHSVRTRSDASRGSVGYSNVTYDES